MNAQPALEIALLVLEQGADWPSWATGIRMRASHSAVEAQLDGESIDAFRDRVVARMADVRKKGMRLKAAGYACSLEGAARTKARREICHQLLLQLDAAPGSELILAGGSWSTTGQEGAERNRLIELWSELSALQTGRTFSIRFEDSAHESGIFHAAARLHQRTPLARTTPAMAGPAPLARTDGKGEPQGLDSKDTARG